jgi:ribonuclease HI
MKEIYCDGSCFGNPGPGGWGVLVKEGSITAEVHGHQPKTTNNQMELMAAITAAKFVSSGEEVTIYTDSKYVIQGITEWLKGWKKNSWVTAKKEPVKNSDLWKELDNLTQGKKINWTWVKAHNGNEGNERVDTLAKMGTNGKSNIHILDELIAKFIQIEIKTEIKAIEKEIKNVSFSLYSIVAKGSERYLVIDDEAVIYPAIKAYLLTEISKTGKSQSIAKETAHQEFKVLNDKDTYQIGLAILNKIQSEHQGNYQKYRHLCQHHIVKKYDSVICDKCDEGFGWYCPDSPDHTCYYYSDEGNVTLIDGTLVPIPETHNSSYESDDYCIFCGSPDERK